MKSRPITLSALIHVPSREAVCRMNVQLEAKNAALVKALEEQADKWSRMAYDLAVIAPDLGKRAHDNESAARALAQARTP